MTDMQGLWLGALLLVLLTLAVLLPSLLKETKPLEHSSQEALRGLYQEQMQELLREHRAGNLSEPDLAQAQEELQSRLLIELDHRVQPKAWGQRPWLPRASGLLLAVVIPVAALVLYVQAGDPQAAARLAQAQEVGHSAMEGQVEAMVDGLAQRLREQPDNVPGWVMLARSYETMGRFADAADAYQRAVDVAKAQGMDAQDQARLWADKADALASAQGGDLSGDVLLALENALQLYPQQHKALALSGSAALARGDLEKTKAYWQALLQLLEPGSDIALRIQDDLVRLEQLEPSK